MAGVARKDLAAVATRGESLAAEVLVGIKDGRTQHPRATFTEIEQELDREWSRLRTRLLEDVALASAATDRARANGAHGGAGTTCLTCGGRLVARGQATRAVTVTHDQTVTLPRQYATCSTRGAGDFPLDEELALLPGAFAPSLVADAVRLGTWVPFARIPELLHAFVHTWLSEPTVPRLTEGAGAAYVAVQTAEVEHLAQSGEVPPAGPSLLQASVDGAMVPLRGKGEWAEVKTLAVGPVEATTSGPAAVELSYFSRRADHETFTRLATVETHRRGMETAGTVCGVVDGADGRRSSSGGSGSCGWGVPSCPGARPSVGALAPPRCGRPSPTARATAAGPAHSPQRR